MASHSLPLRLRLVTLAVAQPHSMRPALRPPFGSRAYAVPSFAPGASAASPASPFVVFDRRAKLLQRDRAAADPERSRLTDYVKDEVAANMVDRLLVSFLAVLELSSRKDASSEVGAGDREGWQAVL